MPYRVLAGESCEGALRRIAAEQLEAAVREIDDADLDLHDTVHEVRKRCKKLRGLFRLFRGAFPDYAGENARLRDTARLLSDLRDATALVESCDALAGRFSDARDAALLTAFRQKLVKRRDAVVDALGSGDRLPAARQALQQARARVAGWSLETDGFDAISGGFTRVQRRARRALRRSRRDASVADLHELRKQAKYHRHHLLLLREVWPGVLDALCESARRLGDRLGDDHDLALLRRVVADESESLAPAARERVLARIDERRRELQARSFSEARRLIDEKPRRLERRLRRLYEAWCAEQRIGPAPPAGSGAPSR